MAKTNKALSKRLTKITREGKILAKKSGGNLRLAKNY